jgi:hypothetical protein
MPVRRRRMRIPERPKTDLGLDPVVRLTNETILRGHMHISTDKGAWRVDFQGLETAIGNFRLYCRPAGAAEFEEWSERFPANPAGMHAIVEIIEAQDGQGARKRRTWKIHFDAHEETNRRSWTLPWLPTDADIFRRMFEELERGEL